MHQQSWCSFSKAARSVVDIIWFYRYSSLGLGFWPEEYFLDGLYLNCHWITSYSFSFYNFKPALPLESTLESSGVNSALFITQILHISAERKAACLLRDNTNHCRQSTLWIPFHHVSHPLPEVRSPELDTHFRESPDLQSVLVSQM